jgi:peptide chain release factor
MYNFIFFLFMPSRFPPDLPENLLQKALELNISPNDIDEHFIRGHGPGGQKKNKTNSCVEIRHRPTGIVTRVERHREQHLNRLRAYGILFKKIDQIKYQKKAIIEKEEHKKRMQKRIRKGGSKEKVLRQKHERSSIKEERRKAWHESLEE